MLVDLMRKKEYLLDYFKHSDTEYLFEYIPKGGSNTDKRVLTVLIDGRNLFSFRSQAGYTNFMCMACTYN
jgi:hypothetical protein